jgi:hypothetical protein
MARWKLQATGLKFSWLLLQLGAIAAKVVQFLAL